MSVQVACQLFNWTFFFFFFALLNFRITLYILDSNNLSDTYSANSFRNLLLVLFLLMLSFTDVLILIKFNYSVIYIIDYSLMYLKFYHHT